MSSRRRFTPADFPAPDIAGLLLRADTFRQAQVAATTEVGYACDWRVFRAWCERAGRQALPSSPETLSLFITDRLAQGKRVTTVTRQAAGVNFMHRRQGFPDIYDQSVQQTLWGARRMRAEQPKQMRPLTVRQLGQVVARIEAQVPRDGRFAPFAPARNRAILLVGFATALRRANLAALSVEDVTFCDEGMVILVRREKQDKQSKGRQIGVPFGQNKLTCPVRSLQAWLAVRGSAPGALFTRLDNGGKAHVGAPLPMAGNNIAVIVKEAIAGIGLDMRHYGPHSLRSGFITEAGLAGVDSLLIAQQSGHKSLESLKRYFRPSNLFRANAAAKVGL